ncbi:MAG: response regulator [Cyanobacteria bacterium SZAS-4]|nr:response regulator [Cyanobacteria bacterium SZAS-4]
MNTNQLHSTKGLSILVVDDDSALRWLMCKQLELCGFDVDQAENGLVAVRLFENNRYCLIFMDIQMPHMDGLQATAAIRCHEEQMRREPTPIIATTAGGASREVCLRVGMSDYLAKPVDMDKLELVLKRWKCSSSSAEFVF